METLELYYQPCPGGARLVRALSSSPLAVLPDTVENLPIVEIGPYCFSSTEPKPKGQLLTAHFGPEAPLAPLAGNYLRELTLPAHVRLMDSAAFYNCRKLEVLRMGSALRQIGSDLFSNCFALRRLEIAASPDAPTGLRKLLGAISADLQVALEGALLYYPEYTDEIDENAPAHVFNHTILGDGYRYRQCFAGDVLNFAEYDATFAREKAAESPENMCRLALGRLRFPHKLSEESRMLYLDYLGQNSAVALRLAVLEQDTALLDFIMELGVINAAALTAGQELALRKGYAQIGAQLLDWQRRLFAPKKKTYDFDF